MLNIVMLRKNLIPIIFFIVLLAIVLWYFYRQSKNTLSDIESSLRIADSTELSKIEIINKGKSLFLESQSGKWLLDGKYLPNKQMVDLLFRVLTQVEISSAISENMTQQLSGIIRSDGSEVKVYDNQNNCVKDLFIYADPNIRQVFMIQSQSKKPFIVELPGYTGNFAGLFKSKASLWRDKTIFNLKPGQIKTIEISNTDKPEMSFKIQISNEKAIRLSKLLNNEAIKFNEAQMELYLNSFRKINAIYFFENGTNMIDSLNKTKPFYKIALVDVTDHCTSLALYNKYTQNDIDHKKADPNLCYAIINDKSVVLVKYIESDLITRDLSFFLIQH
jgi:hypothetical protein